MHQDIYVDPGLWGWVGTAWSAGMSLRCYHSHGSCGHTALLFPRRRPASRGAGRATGVLGGGDTHTGTGSPPATSGGEIC